MLIFKISYVPGKYLQDRHIVMEFTPVLAQV
jgi:hypothetical protein